MNLNNHEPLSVSKQNVVSLNLYSLGHSSEKSYWGDKLQRSQGKEFGLTVTDRILMTFAFVGALVFSYALYMDTRESVPEGAIEIGRIQTDGFVQRRHSKQLSWKAIKNENSIYLYDYLFVPGNVKATVYLENNRTIEISPNSMIYFGDLAQDSLSITLFAGRISSSPGVQVLKSAPLIQQENEESIHLLPSVEPYEIRQIELAQRIEGLQSKLELASVTDNYKTEFQDLSGTNEFAFELVSPEANATVEKSPGEWTDLSWTALNGKEVIYTIEFSREGEFHEVVRYATKKNLVKVQIEEPGLYYWRVRAKTDSESLLSPVSSFSVQIK